MDKKISYRIEDVANIIPKGYENAIKLEQITAILENMGILNNAYDNNRKTREILERVGYEYVICNLQDGHGYFRPTKQDTELFRKWLKQEESRLSKISIRLKTGRGLFEDFLKDRLEEQEIK